MVVEAHARLDLPFDSVRDWLIAAPVFEDRGRVEPDGSLHITFGVGTLRVGISGSAAALRLASPDEANLQALRDFIAETAAEAGVSPVWQERPAQGRPATLCLVRVNRVERISPAFRRVWVQGADLSRLMRGGLHFRLLLGPADAGWPELDPAGLTRWPGGPTAWHRPVYTLRSIAGEGASTCASFDIFLHDGGRVTAWSGGVQAGEEIALMGPSGGDIPEGCGGPAPWFGLYGDETALPALARILAALPAQARGTAVVQVPQAADRQALDHPPGVTLHWLLRDGAGGGLVDALRAGTIPPKDRFVFFAAGASDTAKARLWLDRAGLTKAEFWAQSYWR